MRLRAVGQARLIPLRSAAAARADEDESFFILSGSVRIYDGTRWIETRPGDFVHVPEGAIHAFRNESGEPASMLLHFAPGAPREDYFEGLIDLAGKSEEERTEFFLRRHDTLWIQVSAGETR